MIDSAREVFGSVKGGGKKYPKRVQWNDAVKPVTERKKAAWKEALGASGEVAKERFYGNSQRRKEKAYRCIYQSKKEVNKQFGKNMSQYMNRNRKLLWMEVSMVNGEKRESCIRIKDGNERG